MPGVRLRIGSVSAKIALAFLAMLATFGGVSAYGALTMRRLGDELRRLSRGTLALRLAVHDLQTRQDSLLHLLERPADGDSDERPWRSPSFVKGAIDGARTSRRADLRKLADLVLQLRSSEPSPVEERFLADVSQRLDAIGRTCADDERLFDDVFGPPRGEPRPPQQADADAPRAELLRHEERLWRDLGELSKVLRARVEEAEKQLEADERRAVWATVLLATIAALLGLGVMALAQRALAPLRRLAASAKLVARGDLKQRVDVHSADEIGQLASEFNAMALALEEREQRLIRSERLAAVGKIAAQITHEVRNPLSSIGLNAELLLEEIEQAEGAIADDAPTLTRAIINEVDRLAAITEQYLRFARLPKPQLEAEDLNAIVRSLLAFLQSELAGRQVTVEARLAPSLPAVAVDENQLRQALLNLVRNAADAMPTGGTLTVETAVEESGRHGARVVVGDTGPGIPAELRATVFEPFFSTKAGGTGLGLALTQQIVVEHGGAIEIDSASGRGTRFTIRLPAAGASASVPRSDEPRPDDDADGDEAGAAGR